MRHVSREILLMRNNSRKILLMRNVNHKILLMRDDDRKILLMRNDNRKFKLKKIQKTVELFDKPCSRCGKKIHFRSLLMCIAARRQRELMIIIVLN